MFPGLLKGCPGAREKTSPVLSRVRESVTRRRRFAKPLESRPDSVPPAPRAIPEPRSADSETTGKRFRNREKIVCQGRGRAASWRHRNHDRKRNHRFMGQSIVGAALGRPASGSGRAGRLLHLRRALGGAQGRHGLDGASALHAGDPPRPAHPALRARGGGDRGDALGEGPGDDPRQGRADLLHQPADGGGERRASGGADAAPEGPRPDGGDRAGDERRRLPPAARGLRAAVGDADRDQHRDGGDREHARLRADRRLGDPAEGAGRADDPGHGDALGLDLPLGAVALGADAAPRLLPAAKAARSGGSTRSRASIAGGRRSGGSGSRRC